MTHGRCALGSPGGRCALGTLIFCLRVRMRVPTAMHVSDACVQPGTRDFESALVARRDCSPWQPFVTFCMCTVRSACSKVPCQALGPVPDPESRAAGTRSRTEGAAGAATATAATTGSSNTLAAAARRGGRWRRRTATRVLWSCDVCSGCSAPAAATATVASTASPMASWPGSCWRHDAIHIIVSRGRLHRGLRYETCIDNVFHRAGGDVHRYANMVALAAHRIGLHTPPLQSQQHTCHVLGVVVVEPRIFLATGSVVLAMPRAPCLEGAVRAILGGHEVADAEAAPQHDFTRSPRMPEKRLWL